MCVWFPMWSLGRPDAPPDEPVLVVDDRVAAASEELLAAGVTLGMPRREAEALVPFATVLVRDPGEEWMRFEPVVTVIEDLVPRVEAVAPGLVLVSISGAVGFYGGEEALAQRVVEEASRVAAGARGSEALVGVADGPFAARWAAATATAGRPHVVVDTVGFLSGLDLAALREGIEAEELIDTFRRLGVSTLGELARLPRDALVSRFGTPGLLAHRLASGEDRLVEPRDVPAELAVEAEFEEPLETLESVAFTARALAERLLRGLRSRGVAPHRVSIVVESAAGGTRERTWRSADPLSERALTDRVWWQLRAWVESGGIPGGIARLRIAPADLSDAGRQLALLEDEVSNMETERSLTRAQALLGPDRVLRGRGQGGRLPQERVRWSRWGEPSHPPERDPSAPWPGRTPSPAPALVPPQPRPIEVEWEEEIPVRVRLGTRWEPVLTWCGPWRLTGRWWRGEGTVDRYQMVTSVGAFLCVVDGDRSYLLGVYD